MMQDSLILEQPGEIKLPDAELFFYPQLLEYNQADILLASLRQEIEWTQNTIRFYGKESLVPRLEAWYGDPGKSYSYSGIHMNPKPWTQNLIQIKKAIEPIAKVTFNSVLINYYRDGKDRVAWHSDDEKELGQNPVIGSISLGAERKFKMRHRQYKTNGLKYEIMLNHGSFLLMKGTTQHHWMHEIPRTAKPTDPRINLTFRIIK
jgi:alkylated DNA repair dioxygenase AlkB